MGKGKYAAKRKETRTGPGILIVCPLNSKMLENILPLAGTGRACWFEDLRFVPTAQAGSADDGKDVRVEGVSRAHEVQVLVLSDYKLVLLQYHLGEGNSTPVIQWLRRITNETLIVAVGTGYEEADQEMLGAGAHLIVSQDRGELWSVLRSGAERFVPDGTTPRQEAERLLQQLAKKGFIFATGCAANYPRVSLELLRGLLEGKGEPLHLPSFFDLRRPSTPASPPSEHDAVPNAGEQAP